MDGLFGILILLAGFALGGRIVVVDQECGINIWDSDTFNQTSLRGRTCLVSNEATYR